MNTFIGSRRKPPLGGLTARPGQHDFAGRITAPHLLVDRPVEPAIVASFQGVHDHQSNTASMLTFIPGLAPFLRAPAGAFGLTSVPRTPTGERFGATLPPTFREFGLGRRWRGFPIDLDDEDVAIVAWGLGLLHIRPALFAHPDDEMLEGFT